MRQAEVYWIKVLEAQGNTQKPEGTHICRRVK